VKFISDEFLYGSCKNGSVLLYPSTNFTNKSDSIFFFENLGNGTTVSYFKNGTIMYFDNQKPFARLLVDRVEEWSDTECDYYKS